MYPNYQWDSPEEEGRYTYGVPPPSFTEPPPPAVTNPTTNTGGGNTGGGNTTGGGKTREQIEAEGREYDRRNGLVGGYFDTQLGIWVNGSPSSGGGGGGGGGGGEWGYLTEPFTGRPPAWMSGPSFAPPTFTPPPDFSYQSFAAPTPDSIYADPSFQFREKQGRQALEQSAAARGLLRTGGTLKDLINYGQNAASQEYSNIFDRAAQAHNMGLQQALGTYATNYGVDRDVYDRLYQGNKATFDAQARENELMNQRNFDTFLADFDIFDRNRKRAADMLFGAAGMGG